MKKPYKQLKQTERQMLDKISVSAWDLIQANSGGHKCITNISGLNFLGTEAPKPESGDSATVKFIKQVANKFKDILTAKVKASK